MLEVFPCDISEELGNARGRRRGNCWLVILQIGRVPWSQVLNFYNNIVDPPDDFHGVDLVVECQGPSFYSYREGRCT